MNYDYSWFKQTYLSEALATIPKLPDGPIDYEKWMNFWDNNIEYSAETYKELPEEEKEIARYGILIYADIVGLGSNRIYELKRDFGTFKPLFDRDTLDQMAETAHEDSIPHNQQGKVRNRNQWEKTISKYDDDLENDRLNDHWGSGASTKDINNRKKVKDTRFKKILMPLNEFSSLVHITNTQLAKDGINDTLPDVKSSDNEMIISWNNFKDKPKWIITRNNDKGVYEIKYNDDTGWFYVEDEKELYDQFSLRYGLPLIFNDSYENITKKKTKPPLPKTHPALLKWKRPELPKEERELSPAETDLPF